MVPAHPALPRTIMVIDVESYGAPERTDTHREVVRTGVSDIMMTAFKEADISWTDCDTFTTGDGVLVLLPPTIPKAFLIDLLAPRLTSGLRRYNETYSAGARIRLRVALHAGEVRRDAYGFAGQAINFTFRILDAKEAKRELKTSTALFVLIVSDEFYRTVVFHDPACEPAAFRQIDVAVKETSTKAWTRLFGEHSNGNGNAARYLESKPPVGTQADHRLAKFGEIIDLLIGMPSFTTKEDRDLVLQQLDPNVRSAIPRYATARADITSIVRTCRHYGDAWLHLVEAIRFFAAGTNEMHRLDILCTTIEQG